MKRYIIFLFVLFSVYTVYSQDKNSFLKLEFTGGYGGYTFEKLEDINDAVIDQLPFDAAVIDNFPSQFYFGGAALVRIAKWYWAGPAYEFHSTGSRVGAKDYSGSYHFDQILFAHQLGLENEIRISKSLKPAVFFDISGGVNFSTWKMEEVLAISDESEEDRSEYVAVKPFVLPAFKISYPVYKNFSVVVQAGYLFDLGGKYHISGNKDYKSDLKIPWSGFRVSVGIEYEVNGF